MRQLDLEREGSRICSFIREYLDSAGFGKAILGLSGGVDSSLSAALAVQALGRENVIGVMLPYQNSQPASLADAQLLAGQLGIETQVVEITPLADAYFERYAPAADRLRRGNWLARIRMCVLYDLSAQYGALVIGTSNRSELLVGYFTQYGDSACALEPIGHLYKTEVWALARHLGLPEAIVSKTPSADLWQGQTDEEELGIRYRQLDEILYELTELDLNPGASGNLTYPPELYQKVEKLMENSAFKRRMPPLLD